MKTVKPERLNHDYACPRCGGFLAVFGDVKNDEWRCIDCDYYYTSEMLIKEGLRLLRVDKEMSQMLREEGLRLIRITKEITDKIKELQKEQRVWEYD